MKVSAPKLRTRLYLQRKTTMLKESKDKRVHVDLSHTVYEGLVTLKGFPEPIICDFLSREDSRKHL